MSEDSLLYKVAEIVAAAFKEGGIETKIEKSRSDRNIVSVAWQDARKDKTGNKDWDSAARVSIEWETHNTGSKTDTIVWYGCRSMILDIADPEYVNKVYRFAMKNVKEGYVPVVVSMRPALDEVIAEMMKAKTAKANEA